MEPNKEIQNEQIVENNEVKAESNAFVDFFNNKKNLYIVIAAITVIVVAIVVAIVACSANNETPDTNDNDSGITDDSGDKEDNNNNNNNDEGNKDEGSSIPENTTGAALYNSFVAAIEANDAVTVVELAEALSQNLPFFAGAMEIEVGTEYFNGFDNYTITGYKSAAVFMPMIGSIPFVGYIFELANDTNADNFVAALNENCNPAWNICVRADQVVAEKVGDKVLFVMCPSDLGEGEDDGEGEGEGDLIPGDVIYPVTLEEGTHGYAYWLSFEDTMLVNPDSTPLSIANALCEAQLSPFMLGAMDVTGSEYYSGFDNYTITDYKSAAVFMPMMGSIPFIGYIFELEDGVDVHNFISDLTENSNTRWNICVEADEKLVGAYDNFVFFLMCPASVEG